MPGFETSENISERSVSSIFCHIFFGCRLQIIDELESLEKRTKLELQPITFQEHISSTSSATVCSDTFCYDVSPGTCLEQSPSPIATSATTVSPNTPFDTVSSDVLCETVSSDLECTHTSSDLTSPACNSKTEYYKSESRCGITMVNVGMQFSLDVAQEIFSKH